MSDVPPSPPPYSPPPSSPPPSAPPPGYVAYGAPSAAPPWTKPIRGLGRALLILQILGAIGSAMVLAAEFTLLDEADDFARGATTLDVFEDELGLFQSAAVLAGLGALAVLVLLIVWSYRIASNLRSRGADPTWKPGLTIVAWLLGGCSLNIMPFLMLREHWTLSDPDAPLDGLRTRQPLNPLIVVWFVLSLGQLAAGLVSGFRGFSGLDVGRGGEDLADTLSDQLAVTWISGILSLAASIVLIFVVRQLTDRHARSIGEA